MPAERPTSPGVRFPPPIILLVGFVAGWAHHRAWPLSLIPGGRRPATTAIGWLAVAVGIAIVLTGLVTFLRHRTAILPNRPAARLVTAGPYRFTRNPMYLGLTTAYVGFCVVTAMLWPLLFLPLALTALWRLVIRREERYLAHEFGDEYAAYRARVGRWLGRRDDRRTIGDR